MISARDADASRAWLRARSDAIPWRHMRQWMSPSVGRLEEWRGSGKKLRTTVCFKIIDACTCELPSHVLLHWSSAIDILFERVYEPVCVWKPLGRDIDIRGVRLSVWQTSGGSTPNRPENPTILVESPLETMKPSWIGIIYVCRSLPPKL